MTDVYAGFICLVTKIRYKSHILITMFMCHGAYDSLQGPSMTAANRVNCV